MKPKPLIIEELIEPFHVSSISVRAKRGSMNSLTPVKVHGIIRREEDVSESNLPTINKPNIKMAVAKKASESTFKKLAKSELTWLPNNKFQAIPSSVIKMIGFVIILFTTFRYTDDLCFFEEKTVSISIIKNPIGLIITS